MTDLDIITGTATDASSFVEPLIRLLQRETERADMGEAGALVDLLAIAHSVKASVSILAPELERDFNEAMADAQGAAMAQQPATDLVSEDFPELAILVDGESWSLDYFDGVTVEARTMHPGRFEAVSSLPGDTVGRLAQRISRRVGAASVKVAGIEVLR
jgi:hypothetical protein